MTPGEVLLDTNAVSDFLLHRSEALTQRARAHLMTRERLTTSTLTIKHFEPIASLGFALPLQDWTSPL